jgi:DNA-directed RNA polymerase sigma subunit (sigma70/sigma32)
MKDYRIELKVKNNLLWQAMQSRGINNAAHLSREVRLKPALIGRYLNLKENVYDRKGNYKESFQKICDYFNMMPADLYPLERMNDPLLNNKGAVEVSEVELKQLGGVESDPVALMHQEQVQEAVHRLIDLITPREAKVVKMRAGIDGREHTFQEIGDELGVCMQRAREIHARAFRRMRYGPRLEAAGVDRNIIGLEE